MSRESSHANALELFAEERDSLRAAQESAEDDALTPDQVRHNYRQLVRKYERLLKQAVKITASGDAIQNRLIRTQAQLDARNAELHSANDKLKDLDKVKAAFTAMLVHDLKSPLSVVKATLEILADEPSVGSGQYAQLVVAASQSTETMLTLINEMLEVSRSETQEITLDHAPVNIGRSIEAFGAEVRASARSKNITVRVETDSDVPFILGDWNKLSRVFANLTSNAIKFTPKGGEITISCRAEIDEAASNEYERTKIRICIADTGEGIPPEELPHIFDPYRQVSASKSKHLGVGLGLAIAKRITEAHGGQITVSSEVGGGTCFSLLLPAHPMSLKASADGTFRLNA